MYYSGCPLMVWLSTARSLLGIIGDDYLQMLHRLTRFQHAELTAMSGACRLQLSPVRQHLEEITDDSPLKAIERQSRVLLLMMFGGILFPNTSVNLVSLRFLHHLERLDELYRAPFSRESEFRHVTTLLNG